MHYIPTTPYSRREKRSEESWNQTQEQLLLKPLKHGSLGLRKAKKYIIYFESYSHEESQPINFHSNGNSDGEKTPKT